MLDDMSNSSFVDPKALSFFEVTAPLQDYWLSSMTGTRVAMRGARVTGFRVKGVGESREISLPSLHTHDSIPDSKKEVASPDVVRSHQKISHFADRFQPIDQNAEVLLLLGRDSPEALITVCQYEGVPTVYHTRLGWALVGPACPLRTSTAMTLRTSLDHEHFDLTPRFAPNGTKSATLRKDCFAEFRDDEMSGLSQDDAQFLRIVFQGIKVNDEGRITMPLPFKDDDPRPPDNRNAVYQRSKNTLLRLKRDEEKLTACLSSMEKNIKARYVEKVPLTERTATLGQG
jgi:hypothetical protein